MMMRMMHEGDGDVEDDEDEVDGKNALHDYVISSHFMQGLDSARSFSYRYNLACTDSWGSASGSFL